VDRAVGHLRQIEEHAGKGRVRLKDAGEERAVAAANVDDAAERREVVGRNDLRGNVLGEVGHGGIEIRGLVGVLRHVVERIHAENAAECRFAGLDTVQKIAPRLLRDAAEQQRRRPHRTRHTGT
jgi:hypothetical protein